MHTVHCMHGARHFLLHGACMPSIWEMHCACSMCVSFHTLRGRERSAAAVQLMLSVHLENSRQLKPHPLFIGTACMSLKLRFYSSLLYDTWGACELFSCQLIWKFGRKNDVCQLAVPLIFLCAPVIQDHVRKWIPDRTHIPASSVSLFSATKQAKK